MSEESYFLHMNMVARIEVLLYAVFMAAFFCLFMPGRRRRAGLIFFLYGVVYVIGTDFPSWMRMAAVLALLAALAGIWGMRREFAVFLGAVYFCIRALSLMMMRSAAFIADRYFFERAGTTEEIYFYSVVVFSQVELIQFILFSVMLYAVGRQLKKSRMELHIKELCFLLWVPVMAVLFVNIFLQLIIVIKDDVVFQLYEQFPVLLGVMPMAALLFYAGIFLAIMSYQKMLMLQEEKEKFLVLEGQICAMQQRMEEAERFYEGVRRMRHEMKNHLANIQGLARNGSYGDMEQYITRMDESMNVFEYAIRTGNAVTDVIINDKHKAACRQGVRFLAEFSYPASDGYDAYDIGIIVSNLLANAIEACGRMAGEEKYIYLSGRQKKKFFLIEVRNSFEGEVVFDKNTKLPISTKMDEDFPHGIGLSNVKREVEAYMGDMDIRAAEKEFCVTVMLQERKAGKYRPV